MRWRTGRRSSNIEDRRGRRVRRGVAGGGIGTLVLVLVAWYFGVDQTFLLQTTQVSPAPDSRPSPRNPGQAAEGSAGDFVSVVLADTEDTWRANFSASGLRYEEPVLVLFTDSVQ